MRRKDLIARGWYSLLVFAGIILRGKQYFFNRSLWLDEAYVSLGISLQSLANIVALKPFAKDLALPPPGFLFIEKISILLFGNYELSLRLFPLVSGIASLFLFYSVAKRYLTKGSALIALGLFVFSEQLIYYSSEVKPYSFDVFCSLFLMQIFFVFEREETGQIKTLLLSLLSLTCLFFSYVSLFIVLPYFFISLWASVANKQKDQLRKGLIFLVVWLFGFGAQYFFCLTKIIHSPALQQGAVDHFYFPLTKGLSWQNFKWAEEGLLKIFINPGGFLFPKGIALFFLTGVWALYQKDKEKGLFLLFPILFVLGLSLLQQYPFGDRFLLFYLPFLYILVIAGMDFISSLTVRKRQKFLYIVLAVFLLAPAFIAAGKNFKGSVSQEESREVLAQLFSHFKKGDALFMNSASKFVFGYYHGYYRQKASPLLVGGFICGQKEEKKRIYYKEDYYMFDDKGFLNGKATEESSRAMLCQEREKFSHNPRMWIFLSHVDDECLASVKKMLDASGKRIGSFERKGAYLFLYDLSQREK